MPNEAPSITMQAYESTLSALPNLPLTSKTTVLQHVMQGLTHRDVQLKIRFGEWLEDGEEWTRKWGLRYQEIDRKREEMIKFGIGKAKREEAAISKVPHAPSAGSHLLEVRQRRLKRTREDQDSTHSSNVAICSACSACYFWAFGFGAML